MGNTRRARHQQWKIYHDISLVWGLMLHAITYDKYNLINALNDCIVHFHLYNSSFYTALCALDVISLRD